MWVDPTRKILFSFIDKDFKIELSMKILAVVRLVSDWQQRLVLNSWSILLTSLATIDCDQSFSQIKWELSPFLLHRQEGRFRSGYPFQTVIQFIAVLGLCLVGDSSLSALKVFDGFNWVLVELSHLWWLILWPVRELLGSHRNPFG